ncbi:MAG: hypothetical protein KI785_11230 [Devosiaceae bacterium]|nr:hypothetical protein [Devosiaceae bacterium MH13]
MSSSPPIVRQELVSRLRDYLSDLSAESRATLVRTIDRARARGEESPVHAIIMEAVRDAPEETKERAERPVSAERAFFDPVEPLLVATPMRRKHRARIERRSLRPIWIWITRDLAPGRLDAQLAALRAAVVDEDTEAVNRAAEEFRWAFVSAVRAEVAHIRQAYGDLQRLQGQLGSEQVMLDMLEMVSVFEQNRVLQAFQDRLPEKLPVGSQVFDALARAARVYDKRPKADATFAFASIAPLLGSSADLVRYAIWQAKSSDPVAIRQVPLACAAMNAALSMVGVEADTLVFLLTDERTVGRVVGSLKRLDDLIATVSRTLDDVPNDPWLADATRTRIETGERINSELEPLLHMIRGVVSVVEVRGQEITPDETSVFEAVFGLTLFVAARDARESLALNTVIEQLERGIENILENQAKQAIERLASADPANWEAATARSAAAVKLFKAYHGGEYASAMLRRHNSLIEKQALAQAS